VLVLWEPMYPGDARDQIDTSLFDDPRVTSFWDPHEISGRWFGDHRLGDLEGIVWDAYYAFAPETRWQRLPNHLVATGAPIIGGVDGLQRNFVPRLGDS
jgi:hypothetical protein